MQTVCRETVYILHHIQCNTKQRLTTNCKSPHTNSNALACFKVYPIDHRYNSPYIPINILPELGTLGQTPGHYDLGNPGKYKNSTTYTPPRSRKKGTYIKEEELRGRAAKSKVTVHRKSAKEVMARKLRKQENTDRQRPSSQVPASGRST